MKRGLLCFVFCVVMASSIDVVLKLSSVSLHPFQMAFWRFFLGGLFCLPVAIRTMKREGISIVAGTFRPFLLSGLICVVVSTGLYQIALATGKASLVSVLYCCNPLFVAVAARWMLGERITKSVLLSSALYLAGMLVILLSQGERTSLISCVLTLTASALFAVYNVLGQRWVDRFPPVVYVTFSFLFGSLEMLLFSLFSHTGVWISLMQGTGLAFLVQVPMLAGLNGTMIPVLLYVGIVATGLNFLALQVATKELGAISASLIFYFKLILSPVLAWLVLQENIHGSVKIAIALIFLALLVKPLDTALHRRRKGDQPEDGA